MPKLRGVTERTPLVLEIGAQGDGQWKYASYDFTTALTSLFLDGRCGYGQKLTVSAMGKPYITIPIAWAKQGFYFPKALIIPASGLVIAELDNAIDADAKLYFAMIQSRDAC